MSVSEFKPEHLKEVKLLVVGSPIIAWKPTETMTDFLARLKEKQLDGVKAATFDTRVAVFHGDAAGKIAAELARAGAGIVSRSDGLQGQGQGRPAEKGELEKPSWAVLPKGRRLAFPNRINKSPKKVR